MARNSESSNSASTRRHHLLLSYGISGVKRGSIGGWRLFSGIAKSEKWRLTLKNSAAAR